MHVDDLLRMTVTNGASDLHLKVGGVPVLRINGQLLPQDEMSVMTSQDMKQVLEELTTDEQRRVFADELELDFAYQVSDIGRFRINAYLQGGMISLACRPVRTQIPSIEALGLPEVCKSLALKPNGLIVVTGPTGCGKSTTLAAMMNYLNEKERRKVVTIEDPIALRQDPDVILVGEMRDLETIGAALTAAETGHLVLTTLHTPSASQAIDRLIDVFPPHQQQQVRTQLSTTLQGVLYQSLVPRSDGSGRIAAVEVMLSTAAIRNLIREGKTYQLLNIIQTGAQFGMQTLDQALLALCRNGIISKQEALARSVNVEELSGMLGGSY
jgi:twitching motility protein PilT